MHRPLLAHDSMPIISGLALLLLALPLACGGASEPESAAVRTAAAPSPAQPPVARTRSLIQTVSLTVVATDTESLAAEAERIVATVGGHVENLSAIGDARGRRYEVTLRVPAEELLDVVEQLKGLAADVPSETRTTEDVTDRVVDLDARTRALEITERELEALLAESRAAGRDAAGIMAIFRELTTIREQRESLRGQLASLQDLVALSKVHLEILPDDSAPTIGVDWDLATSARNAVQSLLVALRLLASLAIYLVIVVLPVAALLFLLWRLYGRLRGSVGRPA